EQRLQRRVQQRWVQGEASRFSPNAVGQRHLCEQIAVPSPNRPHALECVTVEVARLEELVVEAVNVYGGGACWRPSAHIGVLAVLDRSDHPVRMTGPSAASATVRRGRGTGVNAYLSPRGLVGCADGHLDRHRMLAREYQGC